MHAVGGAAEHGATPDRGDSDGTTTAKRRCMSNHNSDLALGAISVEALHAVTGGGSRAQLQQATKSFGELSSSLSSSLKSLGDATDSAARKQ